MPSKSNSLPDEHQLKLVEILNRRLADTIDLQLQSRQAYWNVKGPHFLAQRDLFDMVAKGLEEYANLIAQRIGQLGGLSEGTASAVANRSSLSRYLLPATDGNGHLNALSAALMDFGRHIRYTREQTIELKDEVSAAIFTEIIRGVDKWVWYLETSQQAEN